MTVLKWHLSVFNDAEDRRRVDVPSTVLVSVRQRDLEVNQSHCSYKITLIHDTHRATEGWQLCTLAAVLYILEGQTVELAEHTEIFAYRSSHNSAEDSYQSHAIARTGGSISIQET